MIIFINGAFGSGKTTVAEKLVREIPDSLLFDPEEVGLMLRSILNPIEWTGDFQDYPMWRVLVPQVAEMLHEQYSKTLIIPMTIWNKEYFQEVVSGLEAFDSNFHHFCLTVPIEVIHQRIHKRGEQEEGHWVYEQTEKCCISFKSELFNERIDSTDKIPDEIVGYILSKIRRNV